MKHCLSVIALAAASLLPTAQAAVLTCTAAAPCVLSELLNTGNSVEVRQQTFDVVFGPRWETLSFSGFNSLGGNFGGAGVLVWAEASGLDWSLVMAPAPGVVNPWRVDTTGASASWSGTLGYDVDFDGLRTNIYGRAVRSNLDRVGLQVGYGQFRNVGGLSLTGEVAASVTPQAGVQPTSPQLDLVVSCAQLEVDVHFGCANLSGVDTGRLDGFDQGINGHDLLSVENRIALDYVQAFGGGGALEVSRVVTVFTEAAIVSEPGSLAAVGLALGGLGLVRTRIRRRVTQG